ncbi:MAG: hypothetical protein KF901_26250, partial [Myxococcales bacterium]|nr:hypothetical protein [Myxococcales bacterium]
MASFAGLPFAAQLEQLRELVRSASADELRAALREAAAQPDPEPFAWLVDALAGRGDPAIEAEVQARLVALPDAALEHVLGQARRAPTVVLLARLIERAVGVWGLERTSALAFAARWLRARDPERHGALLAAADADLEALATHGPESLADARIGAALFFASGARLASLAADPRLAPIVNAKVRDVVDALARAPKSISQANAERLLAGRVYADPGHFFFELLQNADDAGATRWRAELRADAVFIRHDGAPFSLLDLVGVLSIGQTTKRADQIGLFGVGFKSVYEVSARPRVRSGALSFEIAHVSIPRVIAAEAGDPGETVLALPLREGAPALSTLVASARRIPPETLLTLPHLRALTIEAPDGATAWRRAGEGDEVTLVSEATHGQGGGGTLVSKAVAGKDGTTLVLEATAGADGRALVSEAAAGEHGGALVSESTAGATSASAGKSTAGFPGRERSTQDRRFRLGAPSRGEGLHESVRVAVALDGAGAPRPWSGPTLFAFLPTAERTGLRILVHARFDVTLDRERLDAGSRRNDALLCDAGTLAARLVSALAAEGHDVLPVLSAPDELAPFVRPFAEALKGALEAEPILRDAAGARLSPRRARLMAPTLAASLAGVELGDGARALDPALDARAAAVARALGARELAPDELVAFATRALSPGADAPSWLAAPLLEALAEAPCADEALRALALLRDGAGKLAAASAPVAPSGLARVYAGVRALVPEDSLEALPAPLRARLALGRFDADALARDLADAPTRSRLLVHGDAFFDALEALDDATLDALRELPLVPIGAPAATGASPDVAEAAVRTAAAARVVRASARVAPLAPHLPAIDFADEAFARRHPRLAARWLVPFDLPELARRSELASLDARGRRALLATLDAHAQELPPAVTRAFAEAPLFEDVHGVARPLRASARVGPSPALVAGEGVEVALPRWP